MRLSTFCGRAEKFTAIGACVYASSGYSGRVMDQAAGSASARSAARTRCAPGDGPTRDGLRPTAICAEGGAVWEAVARAFPRLSEESIALAFSAGDVVDADANPLAPQQSVKRGSSVFVFRPIPDEPDAPLELDVVGGTDRWVAVDKPAGMATMPRGKHVAQTVTIAARRQFANPEIVAAHRLDAATRGVLLLTLGKRWRAPYQTLFERREVRKTYLAVAPADDRFVEAQTVALALAKPRGSLTALVVDGQPNAVTTVRLADERRGLGLYEIEPKTGRTHQIRVTMSHLGIPIVGDWLYPEVRDGGNLQLLAARLGFVDPANGLEVALKSAQTLDCW